MLKRRREVEELKRVEWGAREDHAFVKLAVAVRDGAIIFYY